jgi:hypothetical protein
VQNHSINLPIDLFNPITLPLSFNSIINFIYVICVIDSID